jgi:hypothetical protein
MRPEKRENMGDVIPIAKKRCTSYENFVAECPSCGHECIFNRASDLRTFEPIGGLNVSCLNKSCGKPFRLVSDTVNEPHEMLIYDCYELLERKHYMNCILSLAQAYEVFFSLFLRVELLYKPFAADPDPDLADLNRLSEELGEKIKEHTFGRMRALFLQQITARHSPTNLGEAAAIIAAFPAHPGEPKDSAIEALRDAKLIPLLKALKATTVHTLRNRVVHKQAYRPTRDQVEAALEEARSILFPLTSCLGLHDDVNWYMGHA